MKDVLCLIGILLCVIAVAVLGIALILAIPLGLIYGVAWIVDHFSSGGPGSPATWQDVAIIALIFLLLGGIRIGWPRRRRRRRE